MAVVQKRFGIYPLYTALQGTSIPKRFGTKHLSSCHKALWGVAQRFPAVGTGHSLADEHPDSVVASSCSKTFGESTPHREAYRAHSSPNSPISPRLVKLPPLEGPARHIVHQTIWNKALRQLKWQNPTPEIAILAAPVAKMAKYQGSKWQLPVPRRPETKPRPRPSFPEAGQRPAEG